MARMGAAHHKREKKKKGRKKKKSGEKRRKAERKKRRSAAAKLIRGGGYGVTVGGVIDGHGVIDAGLAGVITATVAASAHLDGLCDLIGQDVIGDIDDLTGSLDGIAASCGLSIGAISTTVDVLVALPHDTAGIARAAGCPCAAGVGRLEGAGACTGVFCANASTEDDDAIAPLGGTRARCVAGGGDGGGEVEFTREVIGVGGSGIAEAVPSIPAFAAAEGLCGALAGVTGTAGALAEGAFGGALAVTIVIEVTALVGGTEVIELSGFGVGVGIAAILVIGDKASVGAAVIGACADGGCILRAAFKGHEGFAEAIAVLVAIPPLDG